jgi:hypothetical protein
MMYRAIPLVKLEFPKSDEELPPQQRKDFTAWRERYGIREFPTVHLADATGRPYAVTCPIGLGDEDNGRHLGKLRAAHDRRDTALSNASKAQGVETARLLDAALFAMAPLYGPGPDHPGDPLNDGKLARASLGGAGSGNATFLPGTQGEIPRVTRRVEV